MKLAPLKTFNAFKSENRWIAFVTQEGRSDEGGGKAICVVYGDTRKECEQRTRIVYKALEDAQSSMS